MKVYDFEYDGLVLSDMGYMLCEFDFNGEKTISNGSQITFNTVKTLYGQKHELTSIEYTECIASNFQICKIPCNNNDYEIDTTELRNLTRWLNRRNYHKFKLLDDDFLDFYFEASFNINQIKIGGKLYGLELQMTTNRPFAVHEPIITKFNNRVSDGKFSINNISDEEGAIDTKVEIKILQDGDITITNEFNGNRTYIGNCKSGEIITMDNPIISTSLSSHKIQNDFNWKFIKLYNTYKNRKNSFIVSIPCEIIITYYPIVKVGI